MFKSPDIKNINLDSFAQDFSKFESLASQLLNQYFSHLDSKCKWAFVIFENNNFSVFSNSSQELILTKKSFRLAKELFNAFKSNSNHLYYPICFQKNVLSVVYIEDKEDFLSSFKLNSPCDLYNDCPFLIQLLQACINYSVRIKAQEAWIHEEANWTSYQTEFYTNKLLHDINNNLGDNEGLLKYSILYDVVSRALNYAGLPGISFFHAIANAKYEGSANNGYINFYNKIDDGSDVLSRTETHFKNFEEVKNCDELFSLKESSEPFCKLIHDDSYLVGQPDDSYINVTYINHLAKEKNIIKFDPTEPLSTKDARFMRKILEMTSIDNPLILIPFKGYIFRKRELVNDLFDKQQTIDTSMDTEWLIYGLGKTNISPFVKVRFLGHSKWIMAIGSELVFYDGEQIIINNRNVPPDNFNETKIKAFYKALGYSTKMLNRFMKVFEVLKKQKHGTMIVVCEDAKDEAERLCKANRGISIWPINCNRITNNNLLKLSSIDGAILLAPDCKCHALGVILDGNVSSEFIGDSGRGARFNSAKLYVYNRIISKENSSEENHSKKETMVIVISEDGYINIFSTISSIEYYFDEE